ncbi:MAG: segregation/condensation protein A [Clostridia bacterium]|nr:segregation/condensation protein A [Clostridia bacterium]
MEKLSYKLPVFEGPLDLLLYLISKNKVDIYDIEIHLLFEQYMEKINEMQSMDMDVASEFLEMAARLVHIKSVMLLPKYEEEATKLKEELTGQLIEYRECRRIAKLLSAEISFDRYCRNAEKIKFDMTYTRSHSFEEIISAYIAAVGRGKNKLPPPREAFSGIVTRKVISVNSKIVYILKSLKEKTHMTYKSLFTSQNEKSELVATFLALLELIKEKRVRIDGDGEYADVFLISDAPAI